MNTTEPSALTGSCLEVNHLSKQYEGRTVLDDVTFSVPTGYVTGFVGTNGAGKTTTIKAALAAVHPTSGTARTLPHERVGVVLDTPPYDDSWRAGDLERGLAPLYPGWNRAVFARELAAAGIDPAVRIGELSHGMGMRLQMAAALAHDPELLILDEPTSGLDPLARVTVVERLAGFMTGPDRSILFSTHITTDLDRLADHLVILDRGRIAARGTVDDVLDAYRIVRGAPSELGTEVRAACLGLHVTAVGWDALMAAGAAEALDDRVVVERPTIEDVTVRIAREPIHA